MMTGSNKKWTRHILMGAAATSIFGLPALAQEEVQSESSRQLDTIIVTAQRRAQDINDVPIALVARTGDELAQSGLTDLADVATDITNVDLFESPYGMPTWVIRGVALLDFNPNNPPNAAVYQDEIYQVSSAFGQMSLFDLERIEVLKGPQGGIYGRNTTGGAVNVISARPDLDQPKGFVRASYGSWDRIIGEAAASAPLIEDKLAVRIAGKIDQGGGWQTNILGEDSGDQDKFGLRGSVLYAPNEHSDFTLIADYARDKSEIGLAKAIGARSVSGVPGNFFCPSLISSGNVEDPTCTTYAGFLEVLSGAPIVNDPSLQSGNGDLVLSDTFGRFDNESSGLTAIANVDLGTLRLTSVTGYRDFEYLQYSDNDATIGEYGHRTGRTNFDVFSQELRLASDETQAFRWLAGINYGHDQLAEERTFLFRDNFVLAGAFAAYGVRSPDELVTLLAYDQTSETLAGFLQLEYDLNERLTVNGSIRYTDEDKSYRNGGFAFPLATGAIAPAVLPNANFDQKADYSLGANWSGKAILDYKASENTLLYASVSRGVKSGGFFGGFPLQGAASIQPYREETVWAYEAGYKFSSSNGRVGSTGSVFYYDFEDLQGNTLAYSEVTQSVIPRLDNIGPGRTIGAELDGYVDVTDSFRIEGAVGYLDAKSTGDNQFSTVDGVLVSYDGQQRFFSPKWSWSLGGQYNWILQSDAIVEFGVDLNGRTRRSEENQGTPMQSALFNLEGYTLVNGQISYVAPNDAWRISLIGKNLMDEQFVSSPNNDGLGSFNFFPGEPRSVMVQIAKSF
ncbi:MAG: TonB-dependent receptor [Hyphomonas sp.]|uniref:TonB-dependent receptor n=1 Tax=Hyphomonas sp. TaxID=87 RepID=UPI0017A1EA0D|nr:TonB-dependent receptor [Hyphomonas sp.]MBA3069102.1 TonB-dependent receptor [Hyphomonas sp.]MBU3921316.1 TonB-dependent receptor [Alphaproteobacteria bacterium]MBU4061517.1 TonB-dependent receptor [Alphaproteobacteria bacterium]MBU4165375.1 TonB-dependent receptor [Alphaproteobacteria bacterium]